MNIQQFFKDNSFKFGEDNTPTIKPNNVLTILRLGLKNYYETYNSEISGIGTYNKNYIYKIIAGEKSKNIYINPEIGCSHEYLARYYSSIGYIQLFFELYLVEMLDNISTAITRKQLKKSELISFLLKHENKEEFSLNRTIQYSKILIRLQLLFDSQNEIPQELHIPSKYRFLNNHIQTLTLLNDLRNNIMHSGKEVLFYYSYEVLFINQIIPIIKRVIENEEDTVSMNRNLHCGLNIIEELNNIKLPYDYLEVEKYDNIKWTLNKVNHLKELGRASLKNPLFMGEWGDDNLKKMLQTHNKKKQNEVEIEASVSHKHLNYHERFVCPCCGTNSLMTFEFWTETSNNKTKPYKAKCLLCSYTVDKGIGEPIEYGIIAYCLFNYIN